MSDDRQAQAVIRRVIQTPQCKTIMDSLLRKNTRFHDVWIAIEFDLQQFAHDTPNQRGDFYWKDSAACFDVPSYCFIYKLDNGTVTICEVFENDGSSV